MTLRSHHASCTLRRCSTTWTTPAWQSFLDKRLETTWNDLKTRSLVNQTSSLPWIHIYGRGSSIRNSTRKYWALWRSLWLGQGLTYSSVLMNVH
jgi:hypothetical protein